MGLSIAIFTNLLSILFGDYLAAFLLMLTIVPTTVCIAAMFFLYESPVDVAVVEDEIETKYFRTINIMAVVIVVYLLAYDLTSNHDATMSHVFMAVLLAALVGVPIYIAMLWWRR
ncbi:putative protein NUCLEAR FUSION DEFECTIVE 4 [Cocos nucifera]|uniref:Nodulin-like domain-containing protein n=1 Tax=Cocos nucifera TaxID=13894 RepID=A0A8K0IQ47_COCNU|nr:putative protein NUCLEAR FUSION DEFECTIVE 4 [Cocos nucifera]